jgi:hypothetical protein
MKKLLFVLALWGFSLCFSVQAQQANKPAKKENTPVQSDKKLAKEKMKSENKETRAKAKIEAQTRTDSKMKSDGTPDRRYNQNKKLKKDGTPDKRYK